MTIGEQGKNGVRNHDPKECEEIINVFYKHGHKELDTARMYAEGTTEAVGADRFHEYNCALNGSPDALVYLEDGREGLYDRYEVRTTTSRPLLVFVLTSTGLRVYPVNPGDHSPEKLRAIFETSLKTLSPHKVRVLYLHAPDRSTPFEDTLREINKLHEEKLLCVSRDPAYPVLLLSLIHSTTFGLSNFAAWEVAEIVITCRKNGWVQPTIYQACVLCQTHLSCQLALLTEKPGCTML